MPIDVLEYRVFRNVGQLHIPEVSTVNFLTCLFLVHGYGLWSWGLVQTREEYRMSFCA